MAKPKPISERELHAFWRSSRYFTRLLLTTSHHQLEIIQRGKYNTDAGPDFKGAVLKIDNKLYRGDVEIHIDARDWYLHGHHDDPAYNNVILHVALDGSTAPARLACENGRAVLQLEVPLREIARSQPARQPAQTRMALPECPLSHKDFSKITVTVFAAGRRRLDEKTDRMRELIQTISWDQLLYRGLCEALGYAKNRKPFLQLARLVPIDLLFNELRHRGAEAPELLLSSMLFGAAGLLKSPAVGHHDAEVEAYLQPRLELWRHLQHTLQIQPMPEASWQFFRLRPQNFPTRRIAALVELIQKFYGHGMLEVLVGMFLESGKKSSETIKSLRQTFSVPASGYWQQYYDFRSRSTPGNQRQAGALLGEKTADEMIVNVVLPVMQLFARETANASLANCVAEVYSAFPNLQSNTIIRKMRRQLFESSAGQTKMPTGSEFQQGLIHLHKNYCTPLKCEACLKLAPKTGG